MDKNRFADLVEQALDKLPDEFLEIMDNVEVLVEDYPTKSQCAGAKKTELLGLYEGVPLTERDSRYSLVLPDKITIFQKPIEAICRTDAEIIDQVEKTVKHEVAHFFGMSDDELNDIEAGWLEGEEE
ncbi:metallopeptidase family protein [Dehalogenimonas sp. 4OHTPN]|uniref:Metallopeptidase family protein n=1 Tax=Dehalogenimonas sp. 4OHTPN TaxID=3166643 RepID=A0AAU8G9R0_9CHLR